MTELDPEQRHVVTAPHQIPFSGTWVAFCTCGAELTGTTAEDVRKQGMPHRELERRRGG